MLSKIIKEKIHHRFGNEVRYPKDCEALAQHISHHCKTRISGSTLRRLYGFVKGTREPRLYTLDIIAEYVGYKSWEQLVSSFEKETPPRDKIIERLTIQQVKKGQILTVCYEPKKVVELRKQDNAFYVIASNDKKLLLNDEVKFVLLELHYPLTFTHVIREGTSIGKLQLATVSGLTRIQKR